MLGPGAIIEGKYRIVDLIGEGGMGAVYEGENVRIRRRVAIKILHANAARNRDAVDRFEREAQAAGRIGSDHILEVLDLGSLEGGESFIVMEFLEGETLGRRMQRMGRLTPRDIVPIVRQALVGLKAAHAAGIIHRDLKPDNLYICREKAGQPDFVKIIDFGISKFHEVGGDMHMTRTGAVMGTPYYMSPEQARGARDIDARSDLYAMGVILYEALSGNKPFTAETFNELLFKIVLSEPPPLNTIVPDIDPAFESIVYKAMARDVAHRFQTADALIAALDGWVTGGKPVTVPPAIGHGPSVEIPAPAALPAAGTPPPVNTKNAAWSSTGAETPVAKKKSALLPVVAISVLVSGLLVLGVALVLAKRHSDATSAAETNAALSESSSSPIAEPAAGPPPAPPPPATAKSEPPSPAPPVASAEPAPTARPLSPGAKLIKPVPITSAVKPAPITSAVKPAPITSAVKPAETSKPAAKPTAKPKVDFGY